MTSPHVVVLGAGPAGLGAAYKLAQHKSASVTVLERNANVGGNAGSFELAGIRVDYGSHRLHPASDPAILADIRTLVGSDLVERPRHGRIRLRGRWIHFPLLPLDLALRVPPSFAAGVATDSLRKLLRRPSLSINGREENFATVLEAGLGPTICRDFYFPYAGKLWGIRPELLSPIQAYRRVSAGSLTGMARKVLGAVPGLKPSGHGRFFYPRWGFGQISEAYHRAAVEAGANILLGATVKQVAVEADERLTVVAEHNGSTIALQADQVWSTIPITVLARALRPAAPSDILSAAGAIDYRAMILIYVVLEQRQFSEFDAHYFPGPDIPISRLSEPKNYSGATEPEDVTVLCAELPCSTDDEVWHFSDEELATLVRQSLNRVDIPLSRPIRQVVTRRLRQAYPIYALGYEANFKRLDCWISQIEGVLSFGRQGLFAHDNTHHALYMAYCAADCLDSEGNFDRVCWQRFRRIFETHVVED